jgi:hypothetical protein
MVVIVVIVVVMVVVVLVTGTAAGYEHDCKPFFPILHYTLPIANVIFPITSKSSVMTD